MRISNKVLNALKNGDPIVALETTIITHGMPYPQNIETAFEVENVVIKNGAVPATIGILDGVVIVGLSQDEIEALAKKKDVIKVSTREIPLAVAKGLSGGTTVSATSFLAEKTNIKVFATGGIGGVHREVNETFDISRDLEELAERDIIVVSSGVKSILDVEKTIEYLETKGVLVLGYKTDEFPTFYSRKSGIKIDPTDEFEVSKILRAKKLFNIKGAILVANPIPEEFEIDYNTMEIWINEALDEMKKMGLKGKSVTPFILSKIVELSKGKSLQANIALIKDNARVASLISKEIASNGLD
ncbi:pseudouridine-5'-phosphate glycosidase [Caldisericum sp.]|jgi:pseudouridine-5'-phosphate glycosidase|uniref:pseudouridine-5'-phosphate glycosidase n=1 Tax=Caldisericum sp. TaxID=2499687 RepID=UPI003D141C15